ncbi:MAG TPA: hypothetical protein VFW57_14820 [Acidimicrobiia bacterium]|nr:hypothetical protein [Acidimicrobiia bacterium]
MSQFGSAPGGQGIQIHDFSPGVSETGLFWTVPVAPETVVFDDALDSVSLRIPSLDMPDAFNLGNSLAEGPTVPGNVGFEVVWTATGPAAPVRSDAHGFAGEFRKARATVAWSGRTQYSRYESDPAEGSKTVFAYVGRERNGVFLR